MFRQWILPMAASLILAMVLSACSQDSRGQVIPEASRTRTNTVEAGPQPGSVAVGLRDATASAETGLETLTPVNVVKSLAPSVVQIVTESVATDRLNRPVTGRGVGTGIILDEKGSILTNNHVIEGAQRITVNLRDGRSLPAKLAGGDATTDLAVIRIDAEDLEPAKLGHSSSLQIGEAVIAIGHALGLPGGPTVSTGVVSALDRSIQVDAETTMVDLIQTDAAINPGNSGGPLVTLRAEVVGVNTAGIRDSQGISFAINIDDAKVVIDQLLERGYVNRGYLGVSPTNLLAGLGDDPEVAATEGILLVQVVPDSPAAKAGLKEEDIIVELGDEVVRNTGELSKSLIHHPPGDTVSIAFFRGSEKLITEINLGKRPNR